MPPSVPLKSKPDEKDIEMLDYSGAINQLNVIAKRDLEETRNQINTANYELAMVRDKIIKDTNNIESWKREEKLKFTNETTLIKNDIIANQNRINNEVKQQEMITADLRTQQAKFETLNQERIALKEELVKLEGRKIQLVELERQVESQRSAALSLHNQASMALAKSEEDTEKNKQENIRLVDLNDKLEKRIKDIEDNSKTYESLKNFVEPKLIEIRDEQKLLDESKKENIENMAKLQQMMLDEKILLQSVLDKKAQLEKDVKDFLSSKKELERQQILSGK